jgi:hypothetical protein
MSRTDDIANSYHAATVRGAWYAPALGEVLPKISPELAVTAPVAAHSVSALLQHLLLWNERVRNTSETTPLPRWEAEKEWAEPAIPWNELVARWNRSRDLLEEKIRNFPAADLSKQVPGRDYPYEYMLEGIVHHAIYHAGQIAMILSMLRNRSS